MHFKADDLAFSSQSQLPTIRTGHPKVWSGGDCVNGGKEVVNGVQEAKLAVKDMLRALGGK